MFADVVESREELIDERLAAPVGVHRALTPKPLRTFELMEKVEWDTLLFFYGIVMAVGGLNELGYLRILSVTFYEGVGPDGYQHHGGAPVGPD